MPGIIRGQAGHSPIFLNLPTQSEIYEWENEATGVGGHALIWLPTKIQWVPLDKSEGSVKDELLLSVFLAPLFSPEKVEDQDSGNLTLNHPSVELVLRRSFHQPSIRPKHRP